MKYALAIALVCLMLAGCGDPFIQLGTTIEGEITKDDDWDTDSNDYMFYHDGYQLIGSAGASYLVTIETLAGDPIHFQLSDLDVDLSSGRGTASAVILTPKSQSYSCCVYLRSDFVGSGSPYRLTIAKQ
jgi:hypothetical protein